MKQVEKKYQCIPFWSWNDNLDEEGLVKQIEWMNENGVGGFFMHARGGLKTEYLGEKWFSCIKACSEKAQELGMEAYAYDENGWPSGFVGGKLLEDIENHDKYLTFKIGEYDENATVSYDMAGDVLKRTTSPCENCLNVYEQYSASTADILNGEVVDKFIAATHEEYKKRDTYDLKGFFTDEPQYYRWATPFTRVMPKYFADTYGEDIYDKLGLLFVDKEGYREFRYKFWKGMQALMLKNFAEKVYTWCDNNGYKLTGHYVEEQVMHSQMESCGGIMPFYEFEHIPGMDWLGKWTGGALAPKQVSSVAAQLGKKQTLTETFACCGWDVSPQQLKEIAEFQYVGGINLMCQHLLPYTEHGQRKRDYPSHFSAVNPWVKKNFKEFNDYFSCLGKTLAESEEIVNVAMFHPLRSTYFVFKRFNEPLYQTVDDLDVKLLDAVDTLVQKQIPFHLLDETLLAKYGKVEGKKLILGNCSYDYIVFPKCYTMDKTSEVLFRQFVENGGKVLLLDVKPTYLEWNEYAYDYLETNTSWAEIIEAQLYTGTQNPTVRTTLRKDENGNYFLYAVNVGDETDIEFTLKGATSFRSYDILKDEYTILPTKLHFDKGQSYLLYFSNETPRTDAARKPLRLDKQFTVANTVENFFTIDYIRYSTDGVTYSEPTHHMGVFNEMLQRRYKGKLYLKYEFNVDTPPMKCRLLAEDTNTLGVTVNGVAVEKIGSTEIEKALLAYDISRLVKSGKNEVVIEIDYFQSEQVYYALFGENVTESLKNCLAYDTDIEAIFLCGDFGVYGDFKKGKKEDAIYIGDNFRIGTQKTEICDLLEDGYPFFAGDITLKQKVFVDDTNRDLLIDWNYHLIDVTVNGAYVGRMMFGNKLDLSKYLQKGENEIELVVTIGNRNLMGPFHALEEEPLYVGPHTWERMGTWKEGKSDKVADGYALIKTIK
ncbi:MAG: hypothetical protein E7352_03075 [Clostridiales bacterium]|nr:hypothetical protein [Clostridiales bacterium]